MAEILDFENNPDHTISQVIDDQSYDFTVQYNKRDDSWWIDVGLTGEDPVMRTKMNVGGDVLAPFRYLNGVPDRSLFLVDTVKLYGRNDREGFVNRYVPLLLTQEEYNVLFVQT